MKRIGEENAAIRKYKDMYPLWIFTAAVSIAMFLSYGYADLKSLTVWSLNLLDCAWDGNLYQYYSYCAENIYGLHHTYMGANYIPLIPWGIWNFPIWILQKWYGIAAIGHAWTLLYSKLFLVAVWGLTLFYSYKIMNILSGAESDKYAEPIYWMLSCPMAMLAVYYVGQTDIISICLFVIAVYKLMEGNKRGFYVFSALSIGAKPYILLAYLAVVLLMEKNIWKIILRCLEGSSVIIIFNLVYARAPLFQESMHQGPSAKQVDFILGDVISNLFGTHISLFILFLLILYFLIYMHSWEAGEYKELIYVIAMPFIIYFAFAEYDFYRMIYLMPFMFILFFINRDRIILNLLLETAVSIGLMMRFYCIYAEFFSNYSLFQFVRNIYPGFLEILNPIREIKKGIITKDSPMIVVISTVVLAAFLLLAVINFPNWKNQTKREMGLTKRQLLWMRAAVPLLFLLLSYYGR